MTLPSTAAAANYPPLAQSSIKSFFQPRQPNYAAPPGQTRQKTESAQPAPTPPMTVQPAPAASAAALPTDAPRPAAVLNGSAKLPQEATIRPVTQQDIQALRRINALLLPVNYPDSFYQRVLDPAESALFSRVILWTDSGSAFSPEPKVVGGVVCRIDQVSGPAAQEPEHALYIQSLCLLSPYRSHGLAAAALDDIIAAAVADSAVKVQSVYAHVWTENEDGLRWYQARGFKRNEHPIGGYYLKLRPGTAWIVRRGLVLPAVRAATSVTKTEVALSENPPATSTVAVVANLPPADSPPRQAGTAPPLLSRSSSGQSGQSFQNKRADMEWNDLPAEMTSSLLSPQRSNGGSGVSSRSSSMAPKKKRDRAYPAAAFGS